MQTQNGHILEDKITKCLSDMQLFDDIYHEDDLRRQWGWDVCSIDHLIVYKDFFIPIQEKWCNTRRRETKHMQRFLRSVSRIKSVLPDKRFLFGVWVSRIEPFDDNKEMLRECNIHAVSLYTSNMDELVGLLASWLKDSIENKGV